MGIRKLKGAWWADWHFAGKRFRFRSPDQTKKGARVFEQTMRRKQANDEPLNHPRSEKLRIILAKKQKPAMDTSVLISFVEAERSKIDPKHRTVECDMLAYGIIYRVLSGIYGQKLAEERAAWLLANPQAEAAAPVQKTGARSDTDNLYDYPQNPHRDESGRIVANCGVCNAVHYPDRTTSRICGKKACKHEQVRRYAAKKRSGIKQAELTAPNSSESAARFEKKAMYAVAFYVRQCQKQGREVSLTPTRMARLKAYNDSRIALGKPQDVLKVAG